MLLLSGYSLGHKYCHPMMTVVLAGLSLTISFFDYSIKPLLVSHQAISGHSLQMIALMFSTMPGSINCSMMSSNSLWIPLWLVPKVCSHLKTLIRCLFPGFSLVNLLAYHMKLSASL